MLQVDGAQINYEWIGDGDRVLTLINGYTRPSTDFRMFARRLEKLGIRCLLFDNRGAGKTVVSRDFVFADMVSDVTRLWDELQVETSCVLGISMGGMIAQQLCLEFGPRVEKLVLVSTACQSSRIEEGEKPWSDDPDQVMDKMRPYFSQHFLKNNKLLVESMVKQIAKAVATTDFVSRAQGQRKAIAGFDVCSRLNELRCPTLIVHGDEDGVVPYAAAKALHEAIPGSGLHTFPGCGHLLLAEKPNEFALLVAEFLNT